MYMAENSQLMWDKEYPDPNKEDYKMIQDKKNDIYFNSGAVLLTRRSKHIIDKIHDFFMNDPDFFTRGSGDQHKVNFVLSVFFHGQVLELPSEYNWLGRSKHEEMIKKIKVLHFASSSKKGKPKWGYDSKMTYLFDLRKNGSQKEELINLFHSRYPVCENFKEIDLFKRMPCKEGVRDLADKYFEEDKILFSGEKPFNKRYYSRDRLLVVRYQEGLDKEFKTIVGEFLRESPEEIEEKLRGMINNCAGEDSKVLICNYFDQKSQGISVKKTITPIMEELGYEIIAGVSSDRPTVLWVKK